MRPAMPPQVPRLTTLSGCQRSIAYCAEAAVYTARLLPATEYRIQLLVQQGDGRPQRVGEEVRFRVQAALP